MTIKSRRTIPVEHGTPGGGGDGHNIFVEKPQGKSLPGDAVVDGKIILKRILEQQDMTQGWNQFHFL